MKRHKRQPDTRATLITAHDRERLFQSNRPFRTWLSPNIMDDSETPLYGAIRKGKLVLCWAKVSPAHNMQNQSCSFTIAGADADNMLIRAVGAGKPHFNYTAGYHIDHVNNNAPIKITSSCAGTIMVKLANHSKSAAIAIRFIPEAGKPSEPVIIPVGAEVTLTRKACGVLIEPQKGVIDIYALNVAFTP